MIADARPDPGDGSGEYGATPEWKPERPRLDLFRLAVAWIVSGIGVLGAALVLPGVSVRGFWGHSSSRPWLPS